MPDYNKIVQHAIKNGDFLLHSNFHNKDYVCKLNQFFFNGKEIVFIGVNTELGLTVRSTSIEIIEN